MIALLLVAPVLVDGASEWPAWRGPNLNGLVPDANPPIEWSETSNIRWKSEIPGLGLATPVVWGDRIYVQTAVRVDSMLHQYKLLALDRQSGEVVWERTARQAAPNEERHHPTASRASTSGITDGEHVYAYFGSQGLFCYDLEGNLKWEKDLGDMQTAHMFGEGGGAALHGNTLLINWDHEGDSFIVAMDKGSGKELWRKTRKEGTSWSTPFVVEHDGRHQVIVSASGKTRSYDLKTGEVIWECAGLGSNVIPTPLHQDGVVYVTSGHRRPAMQAILLDKAKGDITGTDAVVWSLDRDTPYVSSPLLTEGRLYFVKNRNAVLSCYDAASGKALYGPMRLEGFGSVYASLVGAGDRIYISDLDGNTLVIRNSSEFEVLATNKLEDGFGSSPMIIGDELYLRGQKYLYRIQVE
jgi:outer membrane protein assembly factor BamB